MVAREDRDADVSAAEPAYGLRSFVVINSLVFIPFASTFRKPRTHRN